MSFIWHLLIEPNSITQLWKCLNRNPAPTVPPPNDNRPRQQLNQLSCAASDGQTSVKHFCFPDRQNQGSWTEPCVSLAFYFVVSLWMFEQFWTVGAFKLTFCTDVTLTIKQNGQMLTVCDCAGVCHHFKWCTKLWAICESFFFSFPQKQQALCQSYNF